MAITSEKTTVLSGLEGSSYGGLYTIENLTLPIAELHRPKGVNLKVSGQFLTITGPSGCGKSTLALCLAGLSHTYRENDRHCSNTGKGCRDYPAGLSVWAWYSKSGSPALYLTVKMR